MLSYSDKNLCNVVLEATDNNRQEKIIFNAFLKLLVQHCTEKSPMKWCLRDSGQNCTGKSPGSVFWTTSGHSVYMYIRSFKSQKKIWRYPSFTMEIGELAK